MFLDESHSETYASEARLEVIAEGGYFDCVRLRAAGPGTRSVVFRRSTEAAINTLSAAGGNSNTLLLRIPAGVARLKIIVPSLNPPPAHSPTSDF